MTHKHNIRLLASLFAIVWVLAAASAAVLAIGSTIPTIVAPKSADCVYANRKAVVDYSNLSEGYLSVKYCGNKSVKIKVQIAKKSGTTYTYSLNNQGAEETFPLVEGDGSYTVKVFENTAGNKYAQALSCTVVLALRNEFLPFLYPNQYVNYTENSAVVAKGEELTKGKKTDLARLTAVYHYVVNNFTYDTKRAESVSSDYLPVLDSVLKEKKGICFDYASVMSAMLRSQGIPCKLVVGYAGTIYHAWINVYIAGTGWVEKAVYFDGTNWSLMDPTFASGGKSNPAVLKYIADGTNYTQKYAY